MKKIIFVIVTLICFTGIAFSQTQIPHHVQDQFKQTNPTADRITWSVDGVNYRVHYYDQDMNEHFKIYDSNDSVIRHDYEISGSSIPAAIAEKIAKDKSTSATIKVWGFIDQQNKTTYYSTNGEQIINYTIPEKVTK